MKSNIHYENNYEKHNRDINDILHIPKYRSSQKVVTIFVDEVEHVKDGYWEIGNITFNQHEIKENFDIFVNINTTDKVLIITDNVVFLADVIEIFDNGFKIKKYMAPFQIQKLDESLRAEIEDTIKERKVLSVIHNKEDICNLLSGFVLIDDELHINIHTEAEFYFLDDLSDLLSCIREILDFEKTFDVYIKIKLCSPGFILLTITAGVEFITKNAIGILLIMCFLFGGEITIHDEITVNIPSIAKGIKFLVDTKKNKKKKEDMTKIINKLGKIRDKMKIKKVKGREEYINTLNEIINELEKQS